MADVGAVGGSCTGTVAAAAPVTAPLGNTGSVANSGNNAVYTANYSQFDSRELGAFSDGPHSFDTGRTA